MKALGSASDTTPRIIKVRGTIDANTDDSGRKPALTAGLETSAKYLPGELATTTGAGVLS